MKDILVTGCTSLLKKNMFDHLREDIRVILADDASAYAEGTKGRVYRYGPEDRSLPSCLTYIPSIRLSMSRATRTAGPGW